ncbi:MAG: endonuclease/exonuclease/phosphatase family protein [Alphaproteobacteria bacterium]
MTRAGALLRGLGAALAKLVMDLIRASLLLTAFGSAALSLVALGGHFSRLLDIVAHFALPGLIVSLFALIVGMFVSRRDNRSSLYLAAVGLVSWGLLTFPDYAARLTTRWVPAGGETVKIIQFNVWFNNQDLHGTTAWILDQDPDVLVLEEVTGGSERILSDLIGRYPYVHSCADPSPCSTMILSKAKPLASGGHILPSGPANLTWITLAGSGGPYTVLGVHQSWPYPITDQESQVSSTKVTMQKFDSGNLIVAGDFNSTPWSVAFHKQDRIIGLSRRTHALPTFPARLFQHKTFKFPAPLLPIDHIYAGKNWQTVKVERGPRLGSDHYPLVVVLRRTERAAGAVGP